MRTSRLFCRKWIQKGDHGGMIGDSGENSGSGQEDLFGPFMRVNPPAVAPTVSFTHHVATTPEHPQAEGSEALAMQFCPGEKRRLMSVMGRHSRESGQIMGEGETKSHKSNSKRSQQGSKGTGPHESLEILLIASQQAWKKEQRVGKLSLALDNSTGSSSKVVTRSVLIGIATSGPLKHARVRLQKQKSKQRPSGKLPTPPLHKFKFWRSSSLLFFPNQSIFSHQPRNHS